MSEIFRSKKLAALASIVALGTLAAGCGSSKSSSSTEKANQAGATTGQKEATTPKPKPSTTTTLSEAGTTPQIDIHVNLCDTGVDTKVKSQYTYTDYTCENSYTVHSGGADWTFSINPTEAAHASVQENKYDSSEQAQASYSAVVNLDGGGSPAGTIDGMRCLWLPDLKTSDTTVQPTSSIMCLGGNIEVDYLQQDPTASLDLSKQVIQSVIQTQSFK